MTTTQPEWLTDWTGNVTGTTGGGRSALTFEDVIGALPPWQQEHTTAITEGDRALEDTDPQRRKAAGWPLLPVADQIQLAQAHYLRAIAAAAGEIATQTGEVDASLVTITDHLDDVARFAARGTRAWWRNILRWR